MTLDLTGKRFGRLTALELLKERKAGRTVWLCKCDCGKMKPVLTSSLRNGNTQSCGCLYRKHNLTGKTTLLNVYYHIVKICKQNPSLSICKEWVGNPKSFVIWALFSSNYHKGLVLTLNPGCLEYSPQTCCFVTWKKYCKKKKTNYLGKKINQLLVVKEVQSKRRKNGSIVRIFECLCDCGNTVKLAISRVISGELKDCGCVLEKRKLYTKNMRVLYQKYMNMVAKCHVETSCQYEKFGAKGLRVCDEWLSDKKSFYRWCFENGFKDSGRLCRKNFELGFSPENCYIPKKTIKYKKHQNTEMDCEPATGHRTNEDCVKLLTNINRRKK